MENNEKIFELEEITQAIYDFSRGAYSVDCRRQSVMVCKREMLRDTTPDASCCCCKKLGRWWLTAEHDEQSATGFSHSEFSDIKPTCGFTALQSIVARSD